MAEIFHIPSGPKNLTALFPAIVWRNVSEYYIQAVAGSTVISTSPLMKIGCCCDEQGIRVHFLNYFNRYDAVNFNKPSIVHNTDSGSYMKRLSTTFNILEAALEKTNIQANDTYELSTYCYKEEDTAWLKELIDTPKAYMEYKTSYLSIYITSGSMELQKSKEEWFYEVKIEFKFSNPYITLRN